MRSAGQWKNVFCLEGLWDNNLKITSSVEPILSLLHKQYPRFQYIHMTCATVTEFKFYINKWIQKRYCDFPILYLAFHGEEKKIKLSDGNVEIKELSQILQRQCKNRMIVFSSCSTLKIDKRIIKSFIKNTGCLAVCGYRTDVAWIKSAAFDMLLIEGMQDNEFSGRGINAIENYLNGLSKSFPDLDFRMVTQKA